MEMVVVIPLLIAVGYIDIQKERRIILYLFDTQYAT